LDDELEEISTDLAGAANLLKGLLKSSGNSPPEEKKVWLVYLSVERSVALLKLHLSIENPGQIVRMRSDREGSASLLATAAGALEEARSLLDEDRLEEALRTLRTSRNCLREFLRDRRRLRLKALRISKKANA